jgi:hypothetical protein
MNCTITNVGQPKWPRFIVQHEDFYWDGSSWTPKRSNALLYADINLALRDSTALEKQQVDGDEGES